MAVDILESASGDVGLHEYRLNPDFRENEQFREQFAAYKKEFDIENIPEAKAAEIITAADKAADKAKDAKAKKKKAPKPKKEKAVKEKPKKGKTEKDKSAKGTVTR